jgi:hypothetical protein
MLDITGEYKIKISKRDEWFLAEITCPDGYQGMTQGTDEEDVLNMIADWIMTAQEVKIAKWKRLIHWLFRYKL